MDIYNAVFYQTLLQCLKTLDPTSPLYQEETTRTTEPLVLSPDDLVAMPANERVIRNVEAGSYPLGNLDEINDRLPAIFLEIATDWRVMEDDEAEERGVQWNMQREIFPIIIRVITYQKPDYTYDTSNPVMLLKIRKQLEYVLNVKFFKNIKVIEPEFTMPSFVHRTRLTRQDALEGLLSPHDVVDIRLECEVDRQYSVD